MNKTPFYALGLTLFSLNTMAVTEAQSLEFVTELQQTSDFSSLLQQQQSQDIVELVTAALTSATIDTASFLQAAMQTFPDLATNIAQVAREAGIENDVIVTAAILAGIDPTQIGQATAAGVAVTPLAAPDIPAATGSSGSGEGILPAPIEQPGPSVSPSA
jgi:DNA-binding phage protein